MPEGGVDGGVTDTPGDALEVSLEHARWRHFGWAVTGLALGLFLISLGQIGVHIGAVLVGLGLLAVHSFVKTFLHPAGVIALHDARVALPVRICSGMSVDVPLAEVQHAYFLRRSLPWTTSGPILVVETRRGTFLYPRDWFAADGDQRRIATSLNRRLGLQ